MNIKPLKRYNGRNELRRIIQPLMCGHCFARDNCDSHERKIWCLDIEWMEKEIKKIYKTKMGE